MTDSDSARFAGDDPDLTYATDMDVRFSDFDTLGHVNNAVYSTYLELARIRYLSDVVDVSLLDRQTGDAHQRTEHERPGDETNQPDDVDHGIVVANIDIDFRAPVDDLGQVSVSLATVHIGTSSFTLAYEIRFEDALVLTAETTQVAIDMETGRPTPIPDAWRRRIVEFEDHF